MLREISDLSEGLAAAEAAEWPHPLVHVQVVQQVAALVEDAPAAGKLANHHGEFLLGADVSLPKNIMAPLVLNCQHFMTKMRSNVIVQKIFKAELLPPAFRGWIQLSCACFF